MAKNRSDKVHKLISIGPHRLRVTMLRGRFNPNFGFDDDDIVFQNVQCEVCGIVHSRNFWLLELDGATIDICGSHLDNTDGQTAVIRTLTSKLRGLADQIDVAIEEQPDAIQIT